MSSAPVKLGIIGYGTEREDAPLVLKRQFDKVAAVTGGTPQDLATLGEAAEVQRVVETILVEP